MPLSLTFFKDKAASRPLRINAARVPAASREKKGTLGGESLGRVTEFATNGSDFVSQASAPSFTRTVMITVHYLDC